MLFGGAIYKGCVKSNPGGSRACIIKNHKVICGNGCLLASCYKDFNMKGFQSISIPQPCRQSWREMDVNGDNRYCTNCSKNVIDFTRMTNQEILAYLSVNDRVCGRFQQHQLGSFEAITDPAAKPLGRWKRLVVASSLLGTLLLLRADAQNKITDKPDTAYSDSSAWGDHYTMGKVRVPARGMYRIITGSTVDQNNLPMQGASVGMFEEGIIMQTDSKGNFKLRIPVSAKQFDVKYIGFETQTVTVTAKSSYQVVFVAPPVLLGEVVVIKAPLHKRVWRMIRKIF